MKWTSKLTVLKKLIFFVLLGLIVGSVSGYSMSSMEETAGHSIMNAFVNLKATGSFFELMYYSFLPLFLVLVFSFFNGFSILTAFLGWLCAFCTGSAVGFVTTMLFKLYSGGLSYSLVIYLPFSVLYSVVILLTLRESDKLSKTCYNIVFSEYPAENKERLFKEYLVKLLVLFCIGLLISALDAAINCIFFDFFKVCIE